MDRRLAGPRGLAAALGLAALGLVSLCAALPARAEPAAPPAGESTPAPAAVDRDLYLAVSVNGAPTGLVAALREEAGVLLIDPEELRSVGVLPAAAALQADGRVRIDRLPGVAYRYGELDQSIDFEAPDAARAAGVVDLKGSRSVLDGAKDPAPVPEASYGALLNYSLLAATPDGTAREFMTFDGVSGSFEGRMFSPYGVFAQTFVASTSGSERTDSTRLDTSWSLSDPETMRTYRAGDLITGGLDWTRPTRLAGFQVRRNFALRSDLVTLPIPELSGSAAVPSTVEVYLDGARRFSREVGAGPFALVNLPVVTGAGTARVVVRDSAGRETVSETAFFSSPSLLAPGLLDYSAELGFGRKAFGTRSADYDPRPMGSASMRYGLTPWLTAEAHAEGGADIANGGLGAAMSVGAVAIVQASAAASRTADGRLGLQASAVLELDLGLVRLRGRSQRAFAHYQDIASIIDAAESAEDGLFPLSAAPPRAIDQVSASVPLGFDASVVDLSFTRLEAPGGETRSLVGLAYNRSVLGRATLSLSGFKDIGRDALGIHASLSVPLGHDYAASVSGASDEGAFELATTVSKRAGAEVGDHGWQIRDTEGEVARRSAYGEYRASFAEIGGGIAQSGDRFRASAHMDGALVVAGRDVFLATPVGDAFAVVDVGVPGVVVSHENRAAGRTDARGKLLLPRLRAYEKNSISIDPKDLPLDTTIDATRRIVVPADRSGVVVAFDAGKTGSAALVTFRDEAGRYIPVGTPGRLGTGGAAFVVGYDGQALLEGLSASNHVLIERADGGPCAADFAFHAAGGAQVSVPDAVCRAGA